MEPDLSFYTVEFVQKPYVKKRGIVNSLLDEFVARMKRSSNIFKPHPHMYGSQNGDRVRFVHFFSDASYYDVNLIANSFARDKTFDYTVKQARKPVPAAFEKGGLLTRKVSLKEIFGI